MSAVKGQPKSFQELLNEKNAAYAERNKVIVALARFAKAAGYKVGYGPHEPADDRDWDQAWKNVIYIDLPTGQVSWHFHRDQIALFAEFGAYGGGWDQHSTEEKYNRLLAFKPEPLLELAKNAVHSRLARIAHDAERLAAQNAKAFVSQVTEALDEWSGRKAP